MKRHITYWGSGVLAIAAVVSFLAFGVDLPLTDDALDAQGDADAGWASASLEDDPDAGLTWDATLADADLPEEALEVVAVDPDGNPVAARMVLGAAGVYPPVRAQSTAERPAGLVWELAETFDGEPVDLAELRVVSEGPPALAFWGDVSLADADETGRIVVELDDAGPLEVAVVRAGDDVAVADATVRLALGEMGLLALSESSDASGAASFPAIAARPYVVTVEAPGFLRAVEAIEARAPGAPGADQPIVVALERARSVAGKVTTVGGAPVAGALVSVHVGPEGAAVPYALVETDLLGHFRAENLPPGSTWAVAQKAGFSPSSSVRVDTSVIGGDGLFGESAELDVVLAPGRDVRVKVVEATGDPVVGALVSWSDAESGLGAAQVTGDGGIVEFNEIPADASFVARQGDWTSPVARAPVSASGGDSSDEYAELTLTLQREGAFRDLRVRLMPPRADVQLFGAQARGQGGALCEARPAGDDPRDWIVESCPEGPASLTLRSAEHGSVTLDVELADRESFVVPEPTAVQVRFEGREAEPWADTTARWTDGDGWHPMTLEPVDDDTYRWSGALYPGDYTVEVDNPRIAAIRSSLEVGEDSLSRSIQLESRRRVDIFALDEQGAPLTGAQVLVFVDGRLSEQARSAGQLPVQVRVRPPAEVTAVVIDPRRGEGVDRVSVTEAGEPEELQLRTQATVGTSELPGRLSNAAIEGLLDADLVAEGPGWLLDFTDPESGAALAGLSRGDYLVGAWRGPSGVKLLTWSRGGGYAEIVLDE